MLIPVEPPPGIDRRGTEYQSGKPQLRYWDQSLTRWYNGRTLGPIRGWRKRSSNAVTGAARAILPWRASSSDRWIAIGTHSKLYVQNPAGSLTDITPSAFTSGQQNETAGTGYGYGLYGSAGFGTPRPDTGSTIPAMVWDLDVWLDKLIGCAFSDGRLVQWDLNTSTPAAAISGAPTGCRGVVVAEQGFTMALGPSGSPRRVQWPDQNDNTDWTPSAANQAGAIDLATAGTLLKGVRLGTQVLILTDQDAHIADYVGLPEVWRFQRVGKGCGALSKGCVVPFGRQAAWWSRSGFWVYDGEARPLPCEVWDFVKNDLNTGQISKISGWHNSEFGELWWHYPQRSGTENSAYIFYSYRDNYWGIGKLSRLCGAEAGVFKYPMAVDASGYCYEHEIGSDYDDGAIFAETGPIEAADGDRVLQYERVFVDEGAEGLVEISFKTRDTPDDDETTIASAMVAANDVGDIRFAARQTRMRSTFDADNTARLGRVRIDVAIGGRR